MIPFSKYVAAGNDFIVLDQKLQHIEAICDRHYGIGGDGVVFIKDDFVHFFNADGTSAKACGNGLRIAAAHTKKDKLFSELGSHLVQHCKDGQIAVSYPDPSCYHCVDFVDDPTLISHPKEAINRNYAKILDRDHVFIKTIERGAAETKSCGTGAIATFLEGQKQGLLADQVDFLFVSNEKLQVSLDQEGLIWLKGWVKRVFDGVYYL